MTLDQYIANINQRYKLGNATEHTYRADLQQLIESIVPEVRATNEPKRQSCGAPDYILTKNEIPVGFIEAKDIGDPDLSGSKKTGNKEQFDRYKGSLGNLIFTDYLEFHLYREGTLITQISIGEITEKGIKPITSNFVSFTNLIKDFCTYISQTITSSKRLAELMAGKSRLLANIIEKAVTSDADNDLDSTLKDQMKAFKEILIHDITPKEFSDVYAQTLAYGMFAARLHDPSLPTFSRQEAAELIPKSNPFLRKLFGYIAGPEIDDRIKWVVDSLVDIFLACNVDQIIHGYGKATKTEDPIIHFYETFLSEYDPKLRKARGVWYTPLPVVNFIIRAVDEILKIEFGLEKGLADTSKTKIKIDLQKTDKRYKENVKKIEQEVHKVQILDPAAGTGTFLAEVIKQVYRMFEGQQGIWSTYVESHLIPRLNGFELLMASYAMAHLKLDLLLTETGYKPSKDQRFRVFLTNSLEEYHPDTGTLFASWLSNEANAANQIKRDTPVMCVIGNPPYSVSSTNKSDWIQNLISDYKKDLNEKKINLDDDYIKFIRFGQHLIDKNGSGVLAYISNNSFIDGITHRQMRKNLLLSFDKIYIIDLHGSAKKNEIAPDGSKDENVFDIQQGVSINIFVKTGTKEKHELGRIFHSDLFGDRKIKYSILEESNFGKVRFNEIKCNQPYYFFVPKAFDDEATYLTWISLSQLFTEYGSGVKNERDDICKQFTLSEMKKVVDDFKRLDEQELKLMYHLKDTRDWKITNAKNDILKNDKKEYFLYNLYRPFDKRVTYYTGVSRGFIGTPGASRMYQMINKDNLGLITCRQQSTFNFQHIFVTDIITDICSLSSQTKETGYLFPLYLYPKDVSQQTFEGSPARRPNLNNEIISRLESSLLLEFTHEKVNESGTFAPIDILDYIYAVLHSPTYRNKYKEFLKIDFPRVPYPKDQKAFWQLVKLGGELRQIHLLESPIVEQFITQYPEDGTNEVKAIKYTDGKVMINDTQYFANVPEVAWNFYIGGYQPAQKWLKDRKGRILEFDDILYYQKIIVALAETHRIMQEIDKINFE